MIQYFSKESALALRKADPSGLDLNGINVGAPVPFYAFTEERHPPIFQFRMRSVSAFLDAIRGPRSAITILDIGCGNGANGRYVARNFIVHKGEFAKADDKAPRQAHVIFADVSDEMLEECGRRCEALKAELPGLTYELAQIDMHKPEAIERFAAAFENRADFAMSIQFLYNTNLQINRSIARLFGRVIRPGGGVTVQTYRRTGLRSILGGYRRLLLGRPTWDCVALDHLIARWRLKREGFIQAGRLEQRFDPELIPMNHFDEHMVELYFRKMLSGS